MRTLVWFFVGLAVACSSATAAEPLVLDVWPEGKIPGEPSGVGAETHEKEKPGERKLLKIGNVTHPTLTIYRPEKAIDTGAAVIIAPGGGYHILAWDLEGTEVAEWFNSIGVTAAVLKYRVPRRPGKGNEEPIEAFQDAQRAVSLVRHRAGEWGIDPKRIGMLGFSAGGHLTARTSTGFDKRSYEKLDAVDEVSPRPDFTMLIYTAYLVNKEATELRPEFKIDKETPPTFLAYAYDDPVKPENSALYWLALKRAGVPAELHIYSKGGHGFGLRKSADPVHSWPARGEEWMKAQGILK